MPALLKVTGAEYVVQVVASPILYSILSTPEVASVAVRVTVLVLDPDTAAEMKSWWRERMSTLKAILEGSTASEGCAGAADKHLRRIIDRLPEAEAVPQAGHLSLEVRKKRFGWFLVDHHGVQVVRVVALGPRVLRPHLEGDLLLPAGRQLQPWMPAGRDAARGTVMPTS